MKTNDAGSILEEVTEAYKLQINEYFEKNKDNMTARNVLAQRKVGANVEIDVVMKYDRRGPGAQIVAKGGLVIVLTPHISVFPRIDQNSLRKTIIRNAGRPLCAQRNG